ncbi:MAG: hypothetical protein RIC15_06650 [Vicingaceae bacterium]
MNKIIVFLERMWLTVAIVSVGIAAYRGFTGAIEDAYYFLFFSVLASMLFLLRRRTRKRMEKSDNHNSTVE